MPNHTDRADDDATSAQPTDGLAEQNNTLTGRAAHAVLAEAINLICRRYPDAVRADLNHPRPDDDESSIILWNLKDADDTMLWPDQAGEVFRDTKELGERFWLGDRDGDPYAELAEINRLLTAVYLQCGADLFEPGELGGGWELSIDRT